jgi:hypothetical protein
MADYELAPEVESDLEGVLTTRLIDGASINPTATRENWRHISDGSDREKQ